MGRPLVKPGPYLLDTHAIIWAVENPSMLSTNATAAIEKGENVLSVASFWEVVIKSRKKQFEIADPVSWWNRVIEQLGALVLPIRQVHVEGVARLDDHNKDPFDRILVAQAIAENFTLITRDPLIQCYPVQTLW